MSTVKDKNTNTIPALPADPKVAPESQKTIDAAVEGALKEKLHNRKKSIGERIFNRGVYTGIGFGANEVGSLIFTGMFERGPGKYLGRHGFERGGAWLAKCITPIKEKINLQPMTHAGGKKLLMWISLNFIGCFVVPAIRIMDGYKFGIVKKLNHMFGSSGMDEQTMAARDREVEEAVACEPVQSWTTLVLGRLAAMGAAIGLGYGILGERGNEKLESAFNTGSSWTAKKIGLGRFTAGDRTPPAHERSRFHYYTGLAGPETLGCTTSSIVLEVASKYFAKKMPSFKNKELRAEVLAKEKANLAEILAANQSTTTSETGKFTASLQPRKALATGIPATYTEKLATTDLDALPRLGA